MSRRLYYEGLQRLAREKRAQYGVETASLGLREVREIYKREGITIDHWPLPRKIKALYMCDSGDCFGRASEIHSVRAEAICTHPRA